MTEDSATEPQQSTIVTNEDTESAVATVLTLTPQTPSQPFVPPTLSQSSESPPVSFMEAYDCAKLNSRWHKVSSALAQHPDWLTKIPTGRRWTILHQIVFSGDIVHLNEVLEYQKNNPDFCFLCKTLDDKTVREVAIERAHVHPQMLRRIERLVASDQLLMNARNGKWDLIKQSISSQPDLVNEKPPFRHLYLAHYLASVGELDIFKELSKKCHFKLDLLAENKTISQIARESNHTAFADYIDSKITALSENNQHETSDNDNDNDDDDDDVHHTNETGHLHFSPGFYDDPGISFIPTNFDVHSLFPTTISISSNLSHHDHHSEYGHYQPITPNHFHTSMPMLFHISSSGNSTEANPVYVENSEQNDDQKASKNTKESAVTEAEQTAYENTIIGNIKNLSEQNLLNSITCCITKAVLRDPVVAADGFTYEREAIENWFKNSNRSPMTNQELENCELKPNHAIKSILQLLQNTNSSSTPSNPKNADSADAK